MHSTQQVKPVIPAVALEKRQKSREKITRKLMGPLDDDNVDAADM